MINKILSLLLFLIVIPMQMSSNQNNEFDTAIFGAGCFWCVEAIFQQVEGVINVKSGYSGGKKENPSYEEVCSGNTGHAEVIRVVYKPAAISYDELLEIFWKTHDPTTLNRQGNDVGTQYRSVIFYLNNEQKNKAELYKEKLDKAGIWNKPIVTEITPFKKFYVPESYHQNYYNENMNKPYCSIVITPKIEKFRKIFSDKVISTTGK